MAVDDQLRDLRADLLALRADLTGLRTEMHDDFVGTAEAEAVRADLRGRLALLEAHRDQTDTHIEQLQRRQADDYIALQGQIGSMQVSLTQQIAALQSTLQAQISGIAMTAKAEMGGLALGAKSDLASSRAFLDNRTISFLFGTLSGILILVLSVLLNYLLHLK